MRTVLLLVICCSLIISQLVATHVALQDDEGDGHVQSRERRGILSRIQGVLGRFGRFDDAICHIKVFTTLASCCKSVAGSLLNIEQTMTVAAQCFETAVNSDLSMLYKILKNYVLGSMLNSKGIFDLSNNKTVRQMGPAMCAMDCIFRNYSAISNEGVMDYSVAATVLTEHLSEEWQEAVEGAVTKCETTVEGATVVEVKVNLQTCYTKPALLVQCVRKALYGSCPPKAADTSAACTSAMANLQKCGAYSLPLAGLKSSKAQILYGK